jgi:hypothetical protein
MTAALPGWSYARSTPTGRVAALLAWQDFDAIVACLACASIVSAEWEPFRTAALAGCSRASATLRVSQAEYDGFYNSPVGIRAQYARAGSHGELADRQLIAALEPRLLPELKAVAPPPPDWLQRSLRGRGAKVWIFESEVESQDADDVIIYEPWARQSLAREGLRAPIGTLLEIKGAWLDSAGSEQQNPAKAHRSYTIHRTGYV